MTAEAGYALIIVAAYAVKGILHKTEGRSDDMAGEEIKEILDENMRGREINQAAPPERRKSCRRSADEKYKQKYRPVIAGRYFCGR